jgi:hypothetical protein
MARKAVEAPEWVLALVPVLASALALERDLSLSHFQSLKAKPDSMEPGQMHWYAALIRHILR